MNSFVFRVIINTCALWFVDALFHSIWFTDTGTLILTAILFGVLNSVIKPVLILFTLPINILSLGLFTLIINAVILEITAFFINGFFIQSFSSAIFASIFISLISIFLSHLLKEK